MALLSWQSRRLLQSCAQLSSLSAFCNRDYPTWQASRRWYGSGDNAETNGADQCDSQGLKAGLGPASSNSDGDNEQGPTAARRDNDTSTHEPAAKGPQSSGKHRNLQEDLGQGERGKIQEQVQEIDDPPSSLLSELAQDLRTWMYAQAVRTNVDRYVKTNLETEFDAHEFLEGAKDAFHTVYLLLSEKDWQGLRPLVSTKMLDAFRATYEMYEAQGAVLTMSPAEDIEASLYMCHSLSDKDMQKYDDDNLLRPSRTQPIGMPAEGTGAAAAATLDPSFGDPGYRRPLMPLAAKDWRGQHMVLGVRIKAKLASQVMHGLEVVKMVDKRTHLWSFVRGPLHMQLPASSIDLPWLVLTID